MPKELCSSPPTVKSLSSLPARGFYTPAGSAHTLHNATDRPARALMLAFPGGFEAMFADIGRSLADGEATRPPSEEEIGRMMETAPRYGVDIVGPPHE